ncbi:hypothetical protein [Algivirga pacifica]|uniref:Lipocalin-like domain-containing protein n=1 Tax=Algivirga pacifica TaxID=1162670 RepID=A0ABP9DD45_9BACT
MRKLLTFCSFIFLITSCADTPSSIIKKVEGKWTLVSVEETDNNNGILLKGGEFDFSQPCEIEKDTFTQCSGEIITSTGNRISFIYNIAMGSGKNKDVINFYTEEFSDDKQFTLALHGSGEIEHLDEEEFTFYSHAYTAIHDSTILSTNTFPVKITLQRQ